MKREVRLTRYLLSILVFGISRLALCSPSAAQPLESIRVAHWGQEKILLYLPLYLAEEEGLFQKRGLAVNLQYSGNDDQVFAAVMSGAADVGIGDPIFAAVAHERGFPGKVIAVLVRKLGISGYTSNPAIPELSGRNGWQGLRVGSFPAPSTTFTLLRRFVGEFPNPATAPKIVQLAIGAQAAGLRSGDVDIATDLEPAVSIAEASGKRVVFSLDSFSAPLAITGITTSDAVLKRKEIALRSFVSALDEALILMRRSPERISKVAQKVFPRLEKNVVDRAVSRLLLVEAFPESTQVSDSLWLESIRIRKESGELHDEEAAKSVVFPIHIAR